MNIITIRSYLNVIRVGGLECDMGVTCIDELVCNLYAGERFFPYVYALVGIVSGGGMLDRYYITMRTQL